MYLADREPYADAFEGIEGSRSIMQEMDFPRRFFNFHSDSIVAQMKDSGRRRLMFVLLHKIIHDPSLFEDEPEHS